jgi:hypothetical protein
MSGAPRLASRLLAPTRRDTWIACGVAIALGAAVRIATAPGDFWLDEVWTWRIARRLGCGLEVFTSIHHSNNHHLNTLVFYWLGEPAHWVVYRIPSLLAGTVSIALAALLADRRGHLEAVLAAFFVAWCFALIHFSSEARGYALAVCFALSAHAALQRDLERPSGWTAAAFALSAALGILAHLIYAFFLAGAIAQFAWRMRREHIPPARAALRALQLLALPLAVLAWLYWVDLRWLALGAGNPTDLANVVARSVGYTLGLPIARALALPYALLAAAIVGAGLRLRARANDDAWISYAVTIIAAPVAVLLVLRPEVVAVRYFLIGVTFALLLLADLLARGLRKGGWRRLASAAALGIFLLGNAHYTGLFLKYGRGGYRAALQTMADASTESVLRVGSDHDFRNPIVLQFYARGLGPERKLAYFPRERWPTAGTEWFILHRARRPAAPIEHTRDHAGNPYTLFAAFDHAAISGFYWALYRNDHIDVD